jgi:hypothetical protein
MAHQGETLTVAPSGKATTLLWGLTGGHIDPRKRFTSSDDVNGCIEGKDNTV